VSEGVIEQLKGVRMPSGTPVWVDRDDCG
jgi:hypothetical protein